MAGWIKLHRKTVKWEWYSDHNVTRLFFHLLMKANHTQTKWRGSKVSPGQLVTGRIQLAEETGLSEQQIRTALTKLKSTSEITIKPTNKYSLITITSWSDYQLKEDLATSNITNNQPTSNQQVTTSKNNKKGKNEKNEVSVKILIPTPAHYKTGEGEKYTRDEVNWLAEGFNDYAPTRKPAYKDLNRAFGTWLRSEISHRNIDQRRKSLGNESGIQGFADLASEVVADLQQRQSGGYDTSEVHSGGGYKGGNGGGEIVDGPGRPEDISDGVIQIGGPDETEGAGLTEHEVFNRGVSGAVD